MKRRVVLVDDHGLFLAGVRAELGDAVEVVGEARTVGDAVQLIKETDPDVVLLDVHLPDAAATQLSMRSRRSARARSSSRCPFRTRLRT